MTAEELVDAEHPLTVDIPVKTPAGQWNSRMKILKSLARTVVRADAHLPSLPGLGSFITSHPALKRWVMI